MGKERISSIRNFEVITAIYSGGKYCTFIRESGRDSFWYEWYIDREEALKTHDVVVRSVIEVLAQIEKGAEAPSDDGSWAYVTYS